MSNKVYSDFWIVLSQSQTARQMGSKFGNILSVVPDSKDSKRSVLQRKTWKCHIQCHVTTRFLKFPWSVLFSEGQEKKCAEMQMLTKAGEWLFNSVFLRRRAAALYVFVGWKTSTACRTDEDTSALIERVSQCAKHFTGLPCEEEGSIVLEVDE